jgi:hypothetical protein
MKSSQSYFVFGLFLFLTWQVTAQGVIKEMKNPAFPEDIPSCGSHQLMRHVKSESQDLLQLSDQLLQNVVQIAQNQKNTRNFEDLLIIPIVFHIVYNDDQENLADSIILNQLQILNQAFRRQNENASQTRPEFLDLVGDTKIEFVLAETDPLGVPTNGITRTSSEVTHFGGVLPFSSNQTAEIEEWVGDSLFYNWFRLTKTDLGGIDAWDTQRYLNVWIGDLRILQPMINNFEELVFIVLPGLG